MKMKALTIILLAIMPLYTHAWEKAAFDNHGEAYQINITKKVSKIAKFFDIQSLLVPPGRIKSSVFRFRINYDLADNDGWQATGIVSMLSMGQFFDSLKRVVVYDTEGNYIGGFSGAFFTIHEAQYIFYNANDIPVGVADIDTSYSGFSIHAPPPALETNYIAQFNFRDNLHRLQGSVYQPEAIDFRVLRIFSAFALDHKLGIPLLPGEVQKRVAPT